MFLSILAVIFLVAAVTAFIIGRKYSTSEPVQGKLSVFANSSKKDNKDSDSSKNLRYAPSLSIVIPCYNEEERLPIMMDQTLEFCKSVVAKCQKTANAQKSREAGDFSDFEIIVVDDCSKDKTVEVFENYKKKNTDVKMSLVPVKPNRGKGFAVRSGFLNASGDYVLMADGDGATRISDVCKLLASVRTTVFDEQGKPVQVSATSEDENSNEFQNASKKTHPRHKHAFIAVGSRAHLEDESIAQRTFFRTVLMKLFHLVVQITYFVGTRGTICHIHDTQCGFKLFDRRLCEPVFLNNRLERFAFDVELFICSKRLGLKSIEVPVNWKEVPGSKVNVKAMIQMGLDCVLMCFTYGLGYWPVQGKF